MRVARGQVNSSQGKSLMPAMNDVKMEQHGKREVNDILYKKKMDTWQRTDMEFPSSKNQDFRGQSYPNISKEG